MVDADGDPGAVVGEVVDSVGDGFAVSLIGKIVCGDVDWFTLWIPFLAGLGKLSDEFFLLGIAADHRVTGVEELRGYIVDVPELVVPVGVLASLHFLAGSLEAAAEETEEFRDEGVTGGVTHLGQLGSEVAC